MEQQTIKDTIHFLGLEISRIQFYTAIIVTVVGGAITTIWYYIRKKLRLTEK